MFSLRVLQLLSEVLSVFLTPFILFFVVVPRLGTMVHYLDSIVDHYVESSDGSDELKWAQFKLTDDGKLDTRVAVHKGPENEVVVRNKIVSSILQFVAAWPEASSEIEHFPAFLATFPSRKPDAVAQAFDVMRSQNINIPIADQDHCLNPLASMSFVQRSTYYSTLHDTAIQQMNHDQGLKDIENPISHSVIGGVSLTNTDLSRSHVPENVTERRNSKKHASIAVEKLGLLDNDSD
ncbi:hypothetical protein GEMRC1_006774 [Eukaryota sp. GEM-RC1]